MSWRLFFKGNSYTQERTQNLVCVSKKCSNNLLFKPNVTIAAWPLVFSAKY